MNTRRIFAITAATALMGAAGTTMAQEATPDTWMNISGTETRAEVVADLNAARDMGRLAKFERGYTPQLAMSDARADVRAETQAAIADGQVAALNAQAYDFGNSYGMQLAGHPAIRAAR